MGYKLLTLKQDLDYLNIALLFDIILDLEFYCYRYYYCLNIANLDNLILNISLYVFTLID